MTLASTIVCEGCKYFFQGEIDRIIHTRHCDNEGLIRTTNELIDIKCRFCGENFHKYSKCKDHEASHYLRGNVVEILVEKKK